MAEDTILSQLVPFRKDIFVAKKEGRYLSECLGQGKRQGVQGLEGRVYGRGKDGRGKGWEGRGGGVVDASLRAVADDSM